MFGMPELAKGGGHALDPRPLVAEVAGAGHRGRTEIRRRAGDVLDGVGREAAHHHVSAFAGELQREYLETDHKHDWSARTGRTAAANLIAVARALAQHPLPAPG
jgi:hypothetical protein